MAIPAEERLTITLYNPANLKKEDLIRGFVARLGLLDRLLNDLRNEGAENAPQHQLILGQRGLGKTMLLRRLAFAVEDDPVLSKTWFPLVFPEEQYNVTSLGDFWLNCVDALSDALDRAGDHAASAALDQQVGEAPADREKRSIAALRVLISEADRLQRRLLLLVDNLDIVLDRLGRDEEWEFRRALSQQRGLHFIGASSRVLEPLYEHGRAFYDFFQIHELKGLDDEETFSVLRDLAAQTGKGDVERLLKEHPARIKTLRLLTGGNPRTVALLFKVLAGGSGVDVTTDAEQLLDIYTPLYKARFEELPEQAQQLVDAMAIHWDPITAGELTEKLQQLTVNQVSAQLTRLESFGVVEKTPWFGEKKAAFQIAERFFNIWYLMRASRRVRRKLIWLVRFLEAWFNQEELRAHASDFLERDPEGMGNARYAETALALSQTVEDKRLRGSLEHAALHAVMKDEGVRRMFDLSDLPPELHDKAQRMSRLHELKGVSKLRIDWGGIDPAEFWRLLGGSPYHSLAEKTRIVEQLPSTSAPDLATLYASLKRDQALLRRKYRRESAVIEKLYEAIAQGDMVDGCDWEGALRIARRPEFRSLPAIAIQSQFLKKDLAEPELERIQAALQAMTEEVELAARAWHGLGNLLQVHLKRYDESEQAYGRAIELDPQDAASWNGLGNLLQVHFKRYEEAEQAYRRAIELDPQYASPWTNLGTLMHYRLKRHEGAEQAYRRAIELDPQDANPWNSLGNLLHFYLKRFEEAEHSYRRAIQLDPEWSNPWNGLGLLLGFELNRRREAAQAYLEALKIDPLEDPRALLFLCDRVAESTEEWPATLEILRQTAELVPDSWDAKELLARLLTLTDQWPAAESLLRQLALNGSYEPGQYSMALFQAIVERHHARDMLGVLEQTGTDWRWRPIYEALKAVDVGTRDYLRRVAPEVRTVAGRILEQIAPSLPSS